MNVDIAAMLPEINEAVAVGATAVLAFLSKKVEGYLKQKEAESKAVEAKVEYEKWNTKTENTISNAIDYTNDVIEEERKVNPNITKIEVALNYIKAIEPEVFNRVGLDRLKIMVKRKVYQKKQK